MIDIMVERFLVKCLPGTLQCSLPRLIFIYLMHIIMYKLSLSGKLFLSNKGKIWFIRMRRYDGDLSYR